MNLLRFKEKYQNASICFSSGNSQKTIVASAGNLTIAQHQNLLPYVDTHGHYFENAADFQNKRTIFKAAIIKNDNISEVKNSASASHKRR